jgi:hypothetical protein
MHRTVRLFQPLLAGQPHSDATDAFEASTMYLCAAASGPGVVADFDGPAAALRFRAALAGCLDTRVWVEPVVRGIRYTYETYRVRVAAGRVPDAVALLAAAWRGAAATLTDPQPLSPSAPRWRRRQELAVAAWRAMLLACPPVRTSQALRVRLPTPELATVAVRSARLLDVATQTRRGPGYFLVGVADNAAAYRLLARLAPAPPVPARPAA